MDANAESSDQRSSPGEASRLSVSYSPDSQGKEMSDEAPRYEYKFRTRWVEITGYGNDPEEGWADAFERLPYDMEPWGGIEGFLFEIGYDSYEQNDNDE